MELVVRNRFYDTMVVLSLSLSYKYVGHIFPINELSSPESSRPSQSFPVYRYMTQGGSEILQRVHSYSIRTCPIKTNHIKMKRNKRMNEKLNNMSGVVKDCNMISMVK